jgi:hypothetical protein
MCFVLLEPYCMAGREIASQVGAVAGNTAKTATTDALSGIASAVESGVSFIVTNSIDLWIRIPSPDLAGEPAVTRIQQWMLPLSAAVAVLGLIIAGARMALTRKASPLIDVGSGLFIIAATSAVGVLLPTLLLRAGDAWSNWVLSASTQGQFAARLTGVLSIGGPQAAAAAVVVLGIIGIIISAIQAVLMLFRQGALVILAGVLPLAAAGTLSAATRPWFRKVTSWMLALICYKPAAAAVYATAFTLIGTGRNLSSVFMGFAMVVMSLLALPVLLRFFTWTTGTVGHAASGGFLQAALSGAAAVGALRGAGGGSGGPTGQARMISSRFAPQPASSPSGSASAGSAPAGAATAAARTGAAAGAGAGASGAAAAGAAGGSAGLAVSGLAAGASAARDAVARAVQPDDAGGAGQ